MVADLPEVTLRPAVDADLDQLAAWMHVPDVYAFLDFDAPPSRAEIKVELLRRSIDLLLIEHAGRGVGFFIVYTRGMRRTKMREFDIAIAELEARQGGVAKAAIRAFEHWAFDEQQLAAVHANIFPHNRPCLELVRACGWPLSEVDPGGIAFRGVATDVVYTHMTPDLLAQARRTRGF